MAGKSTHCSIFRRPGQRPGWRPARFRAAIAVTAGIAIAGLAAAEGPEAPGGVVSATANAVIASATIGRVAWLTGTWRAVRIVPARDGQGAPVTRIVEEHWRGPLAGSMLGLGRTVHGDALVEYEFVLLRESEGGLAYEAHPSGQEPAVFHSIEIGDSSVVFENAAHDFPRRVGYRRAGADSLIAWIEGELDGRTRRIEFPYRRHEDASPR